MQEGDTGLWKKIVKNLCFRLSDLIQQNVTVGTAKNRKTNVTFSEQYKFAHTDIKSRICLPCGVVEGRDVGFSLFLMLESESSGPDWESFSQQATCAFAG